jgi:hypothetical protein
MSLILPTVSVTLGPTYATMIESAFGLVDSHTHAPGSGARVPSAGININTDLAWNGYSATQLKTTSYQAQGGTLSSSTTNAVYSVAGNLYWNNGGGTAVQITNGGGLNISSLITSVWSPYSTSTDYTILAADPYSYIAVVTSIGARVITLPAANAVAFGRYYWIVDTSGNAYTNNLTIECVGLDDIDGATSAVVNVNYGGVLLVSDGSSTWHAAERTATTTKPGTVVLAGDLAGVASAPTVAKVNAATVPAAGMLTTGHVLQVTGASALSYAAVNLAGGADFVMGVLPSANMFQATTGTSGAVQLANDLGGTAAAPTVVQISGSSGIGSIIPVLGQQLRFDKGNASASIMFQDRTTAGTGANLLFFGQSANSSGSGGHFSMFPGLQAGGGTNVDGALKVYDPTATSVLLKVGGVSGSTNRHAVSLFGDATSTNMPDVLYDRTLFLHNIPGSPPDAVTNPSGGAAIYSYNGVIWIRGVNGANPVSYGIKHLDTAPSAGAIAMPTLYSGSTLRIGIGGVEYKILLHPV